ncbi:flagellar filament capping protein FliD [Sphingomonas oligoaromativorans]|uniref:flagellar filament capping protein FliD n=1 Tax=Sphingomonas oligoaromativorans TaxID=575322 RepID=UPI0014225F9B|nr:flagellar filament capping protein FliD [Sphingomonas oligoaromativorans]NIJ32000.1 flagellar hook-associated protein 2 [Sphingomonas oligoaromativorans]
MTTTSATSSSTAASTSTTSSSSSSSSTSTSTNASLGQSILSGLNAGAGIDTDNIITSLTAAQKASLEDGITAKQATNTAQLSAEGSIASDLLTFSQSLQTLISGGSLQVQPVSSNANVMKVTAKAGVPLGDLTSTIHVDALAQAQSIKSTTFASGQTFNSGTLTLTVSGGSPITVNVDSSNNTVAGIAQAINAQGGAVTANVVTAADGSSTLVLKGKTGAAQAFTVLGSDTGTGGQSLSSLSYGGGATGGMSLTTAAQDASITVDGVTVTRPSNSFDDVIPGVSMTLTGTGDVSLSSSVPTDAINEAVNDFVTAYNSLMGEITTATAAASSGGTAGPLYGNTSMRQLKDQLSKLTTTALTATGSVRTLAELGVGTNLDGTLTVDQTKLSKMLTSYPNDVAAMFQTSQSSSSGQVLITSTAGAAASGVYTITGITPALNGGNATGSVNGIPMNASSWNLTAPVGSGADGLALQILSGAPGTATITINQGLGGALQTLANAMTNSSSGVLTALNKSLTTQKSNLADALTKADTQVQVYHDRLVSQFTTMNTLVSGYKATQSYLTQQVDLWTKSTS